MKNDEYRKLKRMFMVGIIFSLITMLGGEMPIGWTVYPDMENEYLAMLVGCGNLSMVQLFCGVFFGGIGIPLQYYGYKAIAQIIENGGSKICGKFVNIGAKAIAFWGGMVHILCVAFMFICHMEQADTVEHFPQSVIAFEGLSQNVIDFVLWIVLPISAVFMVAYIPMTVAMIIPVVKGKTVFPKWAVVFNPIFFKILLNAVGYIAPNTEIVNAIRMSNMGIGSLVTFLGMYLLLIKYNKECKASLNAA